MNTKHKKSNRTENFSLLPPHFSLFPFSLLLFFAGLCLTGCPTEADEGWTGPVLKVTIRMPDGLESSADIYDTFAGAVYYSLKTGQQADPHSQNWDIAFFCVDRTPSILTNSGVTAASLVSGGNGGVWYSDKSLEDAGPDDRKAGGEYDAYIIDVERWGATMSEPARQRMNIMTYLGFPYGTGTEADPFLPHTMEEMGTYRGYNFNKKQFYWWYSMPPKYSPTGQTYIIRHGDGVKFSKIRVSDIYLEAVPDAQWVYTWYYVFEVQYANFD
jgi:hypothetical protein